MSYTTALHVEIRHSEGEDRGAVMYESCFDKLIDFMEPYSYEPWHGGGQDGTMDIDSWLISEGFYVTLEMYETDGAIYIKLFYNCEELLGFNSIVETIKSEIYKTAEKNKHVALPRV